MSNNFPPLDTIGAKRVLCAIIEQARADLELKTERDAAMRFFNSHAFEVVAFALGLNERRIRRVCQEIYEQNNPRVKKSKKKWCRATGPRKHKLGKVSGELRPDISQEIPTHLK
jgi:hypothetical protein